MPVHGHSTGRRSVGYICPILERWLKLPVPEKYREIYEEAMYRIDELFPHHGNRSDDTAHGLPSREDLREIEMIQAGLFDLTGVQVDHAKLYRYIYECRDHGIGID